MTMRSIAPTIASDQMVALLGVLGLPGHGATGVEAEQHPAAVGQSRERGGDGLTGMHRALVVHQDRWGMVAEEEDQQRSEEQRRDDLGGDPEVDDEPQQVQADRVDERVDGHHHERQFDAGGGAGGRDPE